MSTGTPELSRMLADVPAIIAATGVAPERLVLFGRSVGSLFALHGAGEVPGIAGLIIESGIADPLERLLMRVSPAELGVSPEEFTAAVETELDQRGKLARFLGRTLVLHARGDDLVDVSHGERLYQWANEPKRLHVFPRGNHNNILAVNRDGYFRLVGEILSGL
jgi:pimeloyl-ACP methyl ester carboxylesterase